MAGPSPGFPPVPEKAVWVVKIGSSLLAGRGINHEAIRRFSEEIAALAESGLAVALVSSGAVSAGSDVLGESPKKGDIAHMQAAAAVGQAKVIHAYEREFSRLGYKVAQILLTHADLGDRRRYLNARNTVRFLLQLGVIPVVNENDTVATEEIQFGDNDTLAGRVANLVEAEKLVILTDQPGLMSADPRSDPEAKLIADGKAGDPGLEAVAGEGGGIGRGGMRTKLEAASIAARSGCDTCIADGRKAGMLAAIRGGKQGVATTLRAASDGLAARKGWLFDHARVQGQLYLDDGAVEHLHRHGSSLLAVGVSKGEGDFARGSLVALCRLNGTEIGRGLVNYGAEEVAKIAGVRSKDIKGKLGYVREEEVVHRDNLVLINSE